MKNHQEEKQFKSNMIPKVEDTPTKTNVKQPLPQPPPQKTITIPFSILHLILFFFVIANELLINNNIAGRVGRNPNYL